MRTEELLTRARDACQGLDDDDDLPVLLIAEVERLREGMREAAILLMQEWGMAERLKLADALADAVDEASSWFDDGGTRAGASVREDLVAALAAYRGAR